MKLVKEQQQGTFWNFELGKLVKEQQQGTLFKGTKGAKGAEAAAGYPW
jgi:hypothetical protein